MSQHFYVRTHVPTNLSRIASFNLTHDDVFGPDSLNNPLTLKIVKTNLVNQWNRQQPDEWRYSILDKDAK